ncbi:hypothetical protein A3Q56_07987, partial [Intoshia linei]
MEADYEEFLKTTKTLYDMCHQFEEIEKIYLNLFKVVAVAKLLCSHYYSYYNECKLQEKYRKEKIIVESIRYYKNWINVDDTSYVICTSVIAEFI